MLPGEPDKAAAFFDRALHELCGLRGAAPPVLDFGCGSGDLVRSLRAHGYDAHGCDLDLSPSAGDPKLARITRAPYRLPFPDGAFDAVVSTSVLEHAQNKEACFREIHRVLRSGGHALHVLPGKWYLPCEPHIFVPLVNVFWPRCPRWWLALWARLGVRNEFQRTLTWRQVIEANQRYCAEGLSYWSSRRYRRLSLQIFGTYAAPMDFFVRHGYGGTAALLRCLPGGRRLAALAGRFRMTFIIQQKSADYPGPPA